ncbi:MAG: aldehyde dehydrogenase [Deltaproteobacteria bacterium]|nr:aldehyde dehydrogenase [Deltaproteobacteria bacterium]MBW2106214.1 aldehyde dehydrogenase [Deltaproteobacteria bacterium]MCD6265342.1 aldehyde dehydrogenase [Deltaproteobacteria bacterium]
MRYAETGYNLEVDLSRGNIEKVATDPRLTELHLGGEGTAAKILWDRVPPEVEPFSPDNLLIFSAGLLCATPVVGANRTIVSTITPRNNLHKSSIFGGYFGPELKHAGYDKIVIRGKSPNLVYLWINNDKVEIRDASHLQGKGALETGELIKQELNEDKAQVAAIGLAGENRVLLATIEHFNNSASRGVAPVMGDKRLKAIAVRGTKDVNIARPAELYGKFMPMYQEIYNNPEAGDVCTLRAYEGTPGLAGGMLADGVIKWHLENFSWGNARERIKDYWSKERKERFLAIEESSQRRRTGCYNCPLDCHFQISYPGRQTYFTKCYSPLTYLMGAYKELDFNYDILGVTQEYGLDGYSTPQVLAFAVELYDNGILTDEDLPGFPSDNGERFFYLVEKIVRREGVGDALANGISLAARQIGRGAEKFDHNSIKNIEQEPLKLGRMNYIYYLMYATGAKASVVQIEGSYPQVPIPDKSKREEYVKKWDAAPERFKKYFLEWEPRQRPSIEEAVNICDWNETMHYIDDATGICAFLSSFNGQWGPRVPYHIHNLPDFISHATGMDLDSDKLWEIAARNRNLVRAINVRRGLRRKDEDAPEDHWKERDYEMRAKLLDAYYEFKGWTNDGIPTKGKLDKLGLDYVSKDFIQMGILTGDEGIPSKESSAEKKQK